MPEWMQLDGVRMNVIDGDYCCLCLNVGELLRDSGSPCSALHLVGLKPVGYVCGKIGLVHPWGVGVRGVRGKGRGKAWLGGRARTLVQDSS